MSKRIRVFETKLDTGERLPILLAPDGSVPFYPSYYSTSICRPRDSASTMLIKLNSIKHLYEWAKIVGVDIESRFSRHEYFDLKEIDSLVYASRLKLNYMIDSYVSASSDKTKMKTVPSTRKDQPEVVSSVTHASRLYHVASYLDWLALECMKNVDFQSPIFKAAIEHKDKMISIIRKRTPKAFSKSHSRVAPPRGFDFDIQQRIVEVIEPDHPENPWKNDFVKVRNQLYVTICLALGVRLGETLKIKIKDVYLSGDYPRIEIRRRVDDPKDTRKRAPRVKTTERPLPIGEDWYPLLKTYIKKYWRRFKKARKHGYLFVSRFGNELSYESAAKIFQQLRGSVDGLPNDLTQHVVRHAWNERFSESGEAHGLSQDVIKESRRFLMGWSVTSTMPDLYDRRYTQRKADEVSLEMQKQFFKRDKK